MVVKNLSKVLSGSKQSGVALWQTPVVEDEHSGAAQLTVQERSILDKQNRDKGFEEGRLNGFLAGGEEIQQQVELYKQMLVAMEKPFERIDKKVEEELVLLATSIAEAIIKQELTVNPSLIGQVVEEAVSALSATARHVSVRLHPQDIALLNSDQQDGDNPVAWHMLEDARLARGECQVDSSDEFVDATVRSRINTIVNESFGIDIVADR